MKENAFSRWFDGRPLRERGALLLAAAVVLLFLVNLIVLEPLGRKRSALQGELARLQTAVTELGAQEKVILARRTVDPDSQRRKRLAVLEEEAAKLQKRLVSNIVNLVPPEEMVKLLRQLLAEQKGLTLVSLENMAPEQVNISSGGAEGEQQASLRVYRHSLKLVFTGKYLDLLQYLRRLQQLERILIWEEVDIETEEYPQATVRLQVHTISLSQGWIGG